MQKYAINISYNGKNYSGWQVQPNKNTIQLNVQNAISKVLKENVVIVASGRTDAGVSALCQVAHFETDAKVDNHFVSYCNHLLPEDIKILKVYRVAEDFNARFSAKKKTYVYNFYVSNVEIPVLENFCLKVPENVDINRFEIELKSFVGEHDFTSFCASNGSATNMTRTIYSAKLVKNENVYSVVISGNGFLYNMVRIIVGTLLDISRGKNLLSANEILLKKDRKFAGKTASSKGLMLKSVEY